MSKLFNYIGQLDKDSAARAAHAADPKTAMTQAGLTDTEQQALLSADKATIAKLAGLDLKVGELPQCFHSVKN